MATSRRIVVVGLGVWTLVAACGTDIGRTAAVDDAGTAGVSTAGAASGGTDAAHAGASAAGGIVATGGAVATAGASEAGTGNVTTGGTDDRGGGPAGGEAGFGGDGFGGDGTAPPTPSDCGPVASGAQATRLRYQEPQVPYAQSCVSEEQRATCTDGVLGAWSGSFVHETCSPSAPSDCDSTPHGAYAERTRFEAAGVAYGQTCASEKQKAHCDNGALGAWSGSFAFEACQVQPPADCGATPHGSYATRTRYISAAVPYGSSCTSQEQRALCNNGSLGAYDGSFQFDACVVGPAADCGGVPHGKSEERTMYEVTSVPFGQICPKEVQVHTCANGVWTPWTGQYVYESCTIDAPATCEGSAHSTVQSRTLYAASSVVFGSSCQSEVQTRVCNNGVWGDWTGTYQNLWCSVQECAVGSLKAQSCGLNNRGTQTMPCTQYGSWRGYWDPCVDPDVCVDGSYVAPSTCNGNQGWQAQSCVNGHPQAVGACGACSGQFVDPCLENKTKDACFKAKYDGASCGAWISNPTPHCALGVVTAQCYDVKLPAGCTPTFGCSWTWL